MQSITEFMLQNGFQEDHKRDSFVGKDEEDKEVIVPFEELSGHSVSTFKDKASRRGWVKFNHD